MKRRTPEQWHAEVLKSLRVSGGWLTGYDLTARITGLPRGAGDGRITQKIRIVCEQLYGEGFVERREYRPEGSPYGRPRLEYRALLRTKTGKVLTMDDIEELAAGAERGYLQERSLPGVCRRQRDLALGVQVEAQPVTVRAVADQCRRRAEVLTALVALQVRPGIRGDRPPAAVIIQPLGAAAAPGAVTAVQDGVTVEGEPEPAAAPGTQDNSGDHGHHSCRDGDQRDSQDSHHA